MLLERKKKLKKIANTFISLLLFLFLICTVFFIPGQKLIYADGSIRISPTDYHQNFPAIYGNKVVWQDYRNGNSQIYLYDITTGEEIRISPTNANQEYPAIYGNKVVWQDSRDGFQIYLYDISTGEGDHSGPSYN